MNYLAVSCGVRLLFWPVIPVLDTESSRVLWIPASIGMTNSRHAAGNELPVDSHVQDGHLDSWCLHRTPCFLHIEQPLHRPAKPTQVVHTMYVSSAWKQRGADWVNIFSQDTMADEAAK